MNLINGIHHSCERREYIFIIFRKYTITFCRGVKREAIFLGVNFKYSKGETTSLFKITKVEL